MARLTSVPDWVQPPLSAVRDTEEFVLRLFGDTKAPQALGSWSALSWLGAEDGEDTRGPLDRRGIATEIAVWAEVAVADAIAEGEDYPPSAWWAERGIGPGDRMPRERWVERTASLYERHYAHGVMVALSWLVGALDDPALMAPMRDGAGKCFSHETRGEYRAALRRLSRGPAAG